MDNIDFYRNRVLSKGRTKQERIINEKIKSFDNYLNSVPNSFTISINNTEHIVTIQDKTLTKDFTTEKYLLAQVDSTIVVGDTFLWSDDYWIVIYKDDKTIESHQGYIITKCNNILTFQTPDTTIHTIPCVITDRASVYSDGVEDTKYLSLPDGLIKIVIPNNELTNTFDLLNKRIIFDHSKESVYKVTKAGKLLKKGLIEIIAEVQIYDENIDNLELNLSNYIDTAEPEIPDEPVVGYSISIIGDSEIPMTQSKDYSVEVYLDGAKVDKSVTWNVSDSRLKIVSSIGTSCTIEAQVGNFSFGSYTLTATLSDDESVVATKIIEVTTW